MDNLLPTKRNTVLINIVSNVNVNVNLISKKDVSLSAGLILHILLCDTIVRCLPKKSARDALLGKTKHQVSFFIS